MVNSHALTQKTSGQSSRGSSRNSHQLRIGIFGWVGSGKTTFLAMLYYLLGKGVIPSARLATADHRTNRYLKPLIDSITGSSSWEQVAESFSGTIEQHDLQMTASLRDIKLSIQINDYPGEMIEATRPQEVADLFLMGCDTLLLFYDLSEVGDSLQLEFHRQNEFSTFLTKLSSALGGQRINIPVVLVVTKADYLAEDVRSADQLIRGPLRDVYRALSPLCRDLSVAVISSKECYEFYIRNRGRRTSLPEYGGNASEPKEIYVPFLQALAKAHRQHRERQLRPWFLGALGLLAAAFISYLSMFAIAYNKLDAAKRIGDAEEDKYRSYQAMQTFLTTDDLLPFFPWLKHEAENRVRAYLDQSEDQLISEMRNAGKDFEEVIRLSELYRTRYPSGHNHYGDEVESLHADAQRRREQHMEELARLARESQYRGSGGGGRGACLGSSLLLLSVIAGGLMRLLGGRKAFFGLREITP